MKLQVRQYYFKEIDGETLFDLFHKMSSTSFFTSFYNSFNAFRDWKNTLVYVLDFAQILLPSLVLSGLGV